MIFNGLQEKVLVPLSPKQALSKIEALYADKLQGKRDALRDAILKGKAGGLSGAVEPDAHDLGSLGEPVTIGASIAAATRWRKLALQAGFETFRT